MQERRLRRAFSPEQKFEILKDIERSPTLKEGVEKHQRHYSMFRKWRRQLQGGIRASLRNSRPLKFPALTRLETEHRKLKERVLHQALIISELKKEMNWDERRAAASWTAKEQRS